MCLIPTQLKALEFQTNQAYEALKRALETREYQDAIYASVMFACYSCNQHSPLFSSLVFAVDNGFLSWERNKPQTDTIDRYSLQLALGFGITPALAIITDYEQKSGKRWRFKPTKVTTDELKAAIDEKKCPYNQLIYLAKNLSEAGHFDSIMGIINYVRENYPEQSEAILTFVGE